MESIKRLRKARGMSLADVAERCGLHREAVARAERAGTDVRATTLLALAKALGVPVCELFGSEGRHERHHGKRKAR
jgi:transcriptional regulator with XRE-family HTH domain